MDEPSRINETAANPATGAARKRLIVSTAVIMGAFISVLDINVVNVALPHMRGSFGVDLSSITWVATSYSIAHIIMIIMSAWWSTVLGRKRYYLISFGIFVAGSILAGFATTFPQMIFFRVLQGIGGGALIPISQAMIRESFPARQQGMAMAVFGMGVVLAPVFGPILGGWLTEEYGWPWIFFINLPFSAVGMTLAALYMEDPPYLKRGIKKVDWGGIILLLVGLVSLQIVLERGQEENWFESTWIALTTITTVAALVLLVYWELRVSEPIINFRVLRNMPLAVGSIIILVFGMAQFGTIFILPQFLQELLGYTPYNAGVVLLPRGVALFVVLPVVGWLFNRVAPRLLIPAGVLLIITALYQFAGLSLEAGMWNLIPPLLIMGAGAPFIFVTLSATSLRSVDPADATAASSFFNLARRMGGNIGFALLTTILERRFAFHRISLISHVNDLNDTYQRYKEGLTALLFQQHVDLYTAKMKSIALIDRMLNEQATMMAYNDVYSFLIFCFAAILPLALLVSGRSKTP